MYRISPTAEPAAKEPCKAETNRASPPSTVSGIVCAIHVCAATGTAPKPENFAHAALTPDALTITFDAYQVGPFAAGTPTVTFTRDSLAAAGLSGVIDGFFGRPTQGTARSAEEP